MTQIDVPAVLKPKCVIPYFGGVCRCVCVGKRAVFIAYLLCCLDGLRARACTRPTARLVSSSCSSCPPPTDQSIDRVTPPPPPCPLGLHASTNHREQDIHKLVYASAHIGTKNSDKLMEEYIWRRRSDCECWWLYVCMAWMDALGGAAGAADLPSGWTWVLVRNVERRSAHLTDPRPNPPPIHPPPTPQPPTSSTWGRRGRRSCWPRASSWRSRTPRT